MRTSIQNSLDKLFTLQNIALDSLDFGKKKRLGLQRNQIFKQGSFLGGRGSAKVFGELCVPLKKTWLRPWLDCMS